MEVPGRNCGSYVTLRTAVELLQVENLVGARQAVGTCSLLVPCPIFLPDEGTEGQRAPAAFSPLPGPAPHQSHFPSGFQRPEFQAFACCLALLHWANEAHVGTELGVGGVANVAPGAWRVAQCLSIGFPPLLTSSGLGE